MKPLRRVLRLCFRAPIRRHSTAAATATEAAGCPFHQPAVDNDLSGQTIKPFEAIPTPKGLPIIGTALDIIRSGGAAKLHEYCDRRHKELGPIYREKLGPVDCVIIANKDFIQMVYTSEGPYPEHLVPEPWLIYNNMRGIKRGLFFMDGPHWSQRRHLLNRRLMGPQEVEQYGVDFNGVISDLFTRWNIHLEDINNQNIIPNLETELYNWSIESLGAMMFGKRLGCVSPLNTENKMHDYVYNVQQIFIESAKMALIPPKIASKWNLPVWRRFVKAADNAIAMSRTYVEERIKEIEALRAKNVEVRGVLCEMVDAKIIPLDEIVNIVADLILAAADTTSHASQWALYALSKNPECQQKLYDEVKTACPNGEMVNEKHLHNMPYSMNVIKETLRMYPIASFLTRTLPRKVVMGGYEIPAGTLFSMSQYTVGRDPERFPEPDKFIPDRWTRTERRSDKTTHACMPFGMGLRSCIGRRIAELKMRLLLTRIVQNFHIESANEKEIGISLRLITTTDQPVKLRLTRRQT